MSVLFTIFTPTFNRKDTLTRCFNSILEQGVGVDEIEWLIVDDGSTDGTGDLIETFKCQNLINIVYFYRNNAGKQAAWNFAVSRAQGRYFIGLDSDDALFPRSLIVLKDKVCLIEGEQSIIGLRCAAINNATGQLTSKFGSSNDMVSSWFKEFASRSAGEKIDVFKTSILTRYLFPVSAEVKFIPEIWFYSTISKKYKFLYINDVVRIFYDEGVANRLSKSSIKKNARGHFIARKSMLLNIPPIYFIKNPIGFLKTFLRFLQVSIYLWRRK
ncbi:glycosyltransferase family 2 protein [Citrobacter freundii]|nr:glycosyltransferase family 2 protein [Citrobacter freundii]